MKVVTKPEFLAVVLVPAEGDDPEDLLDIIDENATRNVILDLSEIEVRSAGAWLKAAGPQIPDADLRIVLNEQGFVMARALQLDALFDWYRTVEAALRKGA
jgi:hypothetical protein